MKKVLVIEPEQSLQQNILTLVEAEGFYGLGAVDGQQGLQLAFSQTPDLILCDTRVPKLDGFTILQSLKYDPEMAQIPFLLMTETGDRAAYQRALALGAKYALPKPLKMSSLRDTIAECLGNPAPVKVPVPVPVIPPLPALPLLQQFFDRTALAIGGLALFDEHLQFVALNQTFAQLNGYPVAAHLGQTFGELLPSVAPIVEPLLRQVLQTGQPILNLMLSGTLPGQPTPLRHWRVSYVPIGGPPQQAPTYVAAIVVDINATDRDWPQGTLAPVDAEISR